MSKVVVFAGTTEGRKISEWLSSRNLHHTVCVATEYGEQVLCEDPRVKVHQGRMDETEMDSFFREEQPEVVIDATHPYAKVVTENIKKAMLGKDIDYIRLERETNQTLGPGRVQWFQDAVTCAEALNETDGNILLTTGSKELAVFCEKEKVKSRLFVRVLPGKESLSLCEEQGMKGKQIIAMQGPFSKEMNLALMNQFEIRILVTKASGSTGGFYEKLEAAKDMGIPVFVVGRPTEEEGRSFSEVCEKLSELFHLEYEIPTGERTVSLIGCGMGKKENLTVDALNALEDAEVVFGAKRLLENLNLGKEQYPFYLADDIIPYLKKARKNAAILFSGDSGFYSGAKKMNVALQKEIADGTLQAKVERYPGISSISSLAAKIGENWEDAKIISVHGKGEPRQWKAEFVETVSNHPKTFVLLSGVKDLRAIGELLLEMDWKDCKVIVGFQMAQEDEALLYLTPEECKNRQEEGLYSVFIYHHHKSQQSLTTGIRDEEFLRDKVPMTKEEVRTVSIAKLHLKNHAIVYDIGSGTGSVAVEIARLKGVDRVYAIERNPEAIALIRENIKKFHLSNVCVIEGEAPEALKDLPAPTNVFIGGSGGNLKEILESVQEKNAYASVVANAVSYETVNALMEVEKTFETKDFEMITMSVTRTRNVGTYHMMKSENQIFICSFQLAKK